VRGGVLRHGFGDWPAGAGGASADTCLPENTSLTLPNWAIQRAAPTPRPALPFAPSRLSGPKTMGEGEGDAAALDYGSLVHVLLENLPNLPSAEWPDFAARLSGNTAALQEATRVLTAPDLAYIFGSSLAEVPITAPLDKGRMLGVIDRLIVTDTHILAVDFKTNTAIPPSATDVPAGLLAQMGAYLAALEQIYQGRRIDMAILWTKTATLMPLDHDMMRAALRRAAIS
jgi:ATP-dependent helicase/nuclease subunit A